MRIDRPVAQNPAALIPPTPFSFASPHPPNPLLPQGEGGAADTPLLVGEGSGVRAKERLGERASKPQSDKLYEACQQFEAVFLLQLWRAMKRTVPQQRQTLNYAEMFDLTFAEYLSRHGHFGIAEKLYEQLQGQLAHPQRPEEASGQSAGTPAARGG